MKKITTHSAQETQQIGLKLGKNAFEGMVLLLSGDLGAGKTTLTQGLALGLEITKTVASPTFTIMKNYKGRLNLNHIDAYRLEGLHQDLGFEEMISSKGVTVIEWPDFITELWPKEYIMIRIKRLSENSREMEVTALGEDYINLMESIK